MSNIEEHIRKAMEEGQFDNLPGKGKPLKLEENPHENSEWRLAYTMLKSSGFSLPWIEARRELEEALEKASADLQCAWAWRGQQLSRNQVHAVAEADWQHAVTLYQARITEINKRILDYNLKTPSARFHMLTIRAEQEIQRLVEAG